MEADEKVSVVSIRSRLNPLNSSSNYTSNLPKIRQNELLNIVQFNQNWAQSFSTTGKQDFFPQTNSKSSPIKLEFQQSYGYFGGTLFPVKLTPRSTHNHTLLSIPFENAKYSLVLLLPDKNSSVPEMLSRLTAQQLANYMRKLQLNISKFELNMPRFNLSGMMDFTALLKKSNITEFSLARVANNISLPANLRQFINVAINNHNNSGMSKLVEKERSRVFKSIQINRPFAYLVVGKHVDLHKKPGFEILIAGFFNGIE